jgi:hypothetical protein
MKTDRDKAYAPAPYEIADIVAIKALANGTAMEHQQKRAMDWIIRAACATYDLSYRPESDRDTAFAEGRRFVGLQIVKALHLEISILKKDES